MEAEHYILVAAIKQPLGVASDPFSNQVPAGLNWARLQGLAQQHRLIPFLSQFVQDRADVPADFREALAKSFHVHVARNTFMTVALLDLLDSLKGKGIRAVPLRGPLLAARLFGDTLYRQCDDLDILLEPDALMEVKRLLVEQGFRPHHTMAPDVEVLSVKAGWEIILKSPDDRFSIELHTQLSPRSYGVRIPMKHWWSHVETWEWKGHSTLTFTLPWLYLANMIHAAKHLWSRLGWIGDLYSLEQVGGRAMVTEAESIAAAYGIQQMVQVGRALVGRTMDMPIAAPRDNRADDLADRLGQGILTEGNPSFTERLRMQASLRDGWWESLRYVTAELCEPSYRDWLTGPALHRMPYLFYLWRPLRLAGDLVSGRGFRSMDSSSVK